MENPAIAALLRKIADILDYQGVAFKPGAYRRAAQTIEDLPHDLATLKEKKALMDLPGIGDAIAEKILEYRETGRMSFLDKLIAETQSGAAGLMGLDDLGPKRVKDIEQQLGIRTIPELIDAARAGRLRTLSRMSEKIEKKILEGALRAQDRSKRFPLKEVESDVQQLLHTLKKLKGVTKIEAAGSYRRRKETVGDVDVLLAAKKPNEALAEAIANAIGKLSIVERVVAAGKTRIAFDLKSKLRVDVRIVDLKQWGSALLYFTGSKDHNISLRRLAIEKGMKLNEYALLKGDVILASKEEADIYEALGLPFIEPENRIGQLPV
jgi:DNA polymerase (family 10)